MPVKVFLRPFRGERIEREVKVKIPAGMPKGEHRILLSDADTLNRIQNVAASANRYMDLTRDGFAPQPGAHEQPPVRIARSGASDLL